MLYIEETISRIAYMTWINKSWWFLNGLQYNAQRSVNCNLVWWFRERSIGSIKRDSHIYFYFFFFCPFEEEIIFYKIIIDFMLRYYGYLIGIFMCNIRVDYWNITNKNKKKWYSHLHTDYIREFRSYMYLYVTLMKVELWETIKIRV